MYTPQPKLTSLGKTVKINPLSDTVTKGHILFFGYVSERVEIKAQREPQGTRQRVILRYRDKIREIYRKDIQPEACSGGEIFLIALGLIFKEIAGTESKLLIVPVFCANGYVEFTQFFLETAGSIDERLEDGHRDRYVRIFAVNDLTGNRVVN